MRYLRRLAIASVVAIMFAVLSGGIAHATPAVPDIATQYWFGNYQVSKIWALGATGQGIKVAVLDSGVQASTPELSGVVLPGTDLVGGDGRIDNTQPDGHGTSMAILIAGQGGGPNNLTGIAPSAKILPVTVHSAATRSRDGGSVFADGIRYAVTHGARIVNLSEGADATGQPNNCPTAVADAARFAIGKGAIVVAAAGNEALSGNPADYPAACPGVVAVGAVDGSKHVWSHSERQGYVDVAGPGVHISAENLAGESGYTDGTSAATALVSGALALVWSKFPQLTNRQILARVLATLTDDATTPGRDDVTGRGIVRPYNAITAHVPRNAPNPIFDEVKAAAPSSGSPSTSAPPSGATSGRPSTGASAPGISSDSSSSSNALPIVIGVVVAVLVVVGALVLIARSRRRAAQPFGTPPPPGPYPPYR